MQSFDSKRSSSVDVPTQRLFKRPHDFMSTDKWSRYVQREEPEHDISRLPTSTLPEPERQWPTMPVTPATPSVPNTPDDDILEELFDLGSMNTVRLMQLSGVMRTVQLAQQKTGTHVQGYGPTGATGVLAAVMPSIPLHAQGAVAQSAYQAGYQPELIEQIRSLTGAVPVVRAPAAQPTWKKVLNMPAVRAILGLLIGIGLLFLLSRGINFPKAFAILRASLSTGEGIMDVLGAAAAFIAAFSIRGVRWSLFLRPIKRVNPFTTVRIFWVAVFMNFLLPVQGGEVIKTFLLKRTDGVPISQSLPTVAMDKSLDLMPALFLMAIMPFIPGIHMTLPLWLILALVSSILLGVMFTVVLTALNRNAALAFIRIMLKLVPKGIALKIEGFALGFVDSLLAGASRPQTFIPALLLTCLALACDGLFAWMCFRTVGLSNMSYGTAILGYTLYNMFTVLPSPPGQVGSNETYGALVFGKLLGFNTVNVEAMFVLSHPLAALVMTTMCFICLKSLNISFASVLKTKPEKDEKMAQYARTNA
jgi:uncharacterized protein (TIRG00374 family)